MSDQVQANTHADIPRFRYNAQFAGQIELAWQQRWVEEKTFVAPNPTGPLSDGFDKFAGKDKSFVMDMFPYPSGAGLHVGHPLGFIATDIFARYQRMAGKNVLHTMGFDAFGLPAEQYAIQTGHHPRAFTEQNVARYREQLSRLGLAHDPTRSVSTTDDEFVRFTQWIFLRLYNSWFDPELKKARPIEELIVSLDTGKRTLTNGENWNALDEAGKRRELLEYRLAYISEAPVNWCPQLGTVLANEEVTKEGRSERGNFPVYRRPMRQWMMRITAYSDRLIDDLDLIDWPDSIKALQRNWIGRSLGAEVDFRIAAGDPMSGGLSDLAPLRVFTTRPDTLFGATYMVLAPEHTAVDSLIADEWPDDIPAAWRGAMDSERPRDAVDSYRYLASTKSELERQTDTKEKSGVFTGSYAVNPLNGNRIPIFIADYVLAGYGTGAIMAVPAHDQRDFEFARKFDLSIVAVVQPSGEWFGENHVDPAAPADTWPSAFGSDGVAVNSANDELDLNGKAIGDSKVAMVEWLESKAYGKATTTYKLRDWLFSRQRYWGEPFPIVWDDATDTPVALPDSQLPVTLPDVDDYAPRIVDADEDTLPEPPLGRAGEWKFVDLDLGEGTKTYRRELNTMPQWAGSCAYYLRYIDPTHTEGAGDPSNEQYWMNVDLYVGGVEHAVLHLLYSRFWHKVLFDLGHVSTVEPFQKLFNQGYILADSFTDERGIWVPAAEVSSHDDGTFSYDARPVTRHIGKMGKSLKNFISPDDMATEYGADALRLYEMSMGPMDADRPWTDTGIVGLYRFLQRVWRNLVNEDTGQLMLLDSVDADLTRVLHKTIAGVKDDLEGFRFNTAVSKLIELNNAATKVGGMDRASAEAFVLMLAPLAPHISEELWAKLGHDTSLAWHPFPEFDASLLVSDRVEIPVQVLGKVRGKVTVGVGASDEEVTALALAEPNVAKHVEGKTVRKVIVIQDKMVNIVAN